jgi:hypothetical protein
LKLFPARRRTSSEFIDASCVAIIPNEVAAGCAFNLGCALITNNIRSCGSSNSLGLEISMNSLVNLKQYAYGTARC